MTHHLVLAYGLHKKMEVYVRSPPTVPNNPPKMFPRCLPVLILAGWLPRSVPGEPKRRS